MNRATDDLISRAVLIDELMAGCMPLDLPGLSGVTGDELTIRNYIDSAPSIDAMPVVHGRWVKMTGMMPPEYHEHYECSECGWHMKGLRNSWTREEELSYCPNCGAKMETEHDISEKAKSNETTIGHWLDGSDDLPPIGGFHD